MRGSTTRSARPSGRVCPTGTQRKERPMTRWISGAPALALAVALVAVIPRFGFTKPEAPLWIARPVTSGTSAPAASPWVELARALKPAVVNISTKRVDAGNQFFDQFFGGRPRRMVRSLGRSEEHTSELQSLAYLVCRLLLEKKKKKNHLH